MINRHRYISLLLALVQATTAMGLLLLSAWFIAACAMAGQVGVLAGFNYVVPAALIRFLAVVRIAAGYFDKYAAHLHLLNQLHNIRSQFLASVFAQSRTLSQSETAQTLQQDTERWAAQWAAIYSPIVNTLSLAIAFSWVFIVFIPSLWWSWLGYLMIVFVTLVLYSMRILKAVDDEQQSQEQFLFVQRQWLHRTTLWPLTNQNVQVQQLKGLVHKANESRHRVMLFDTMVAHFLVAVSLLAASALPVLVFSSGESASALWTLPFFVLLATRDWLVPAVSALTERARLRVKAGFCFDQDSNVKVSQHKTSHSVSSEQTSGPLSLKTFIWQRNDKSGIPLTITLPVTGLAILEAPTGSGKSSLFAALVGEIPYSGHALVNGVELNDLRSETRTRFIHHAEQFGHVFSASLRANLRIAKPSATDNELLDALQWAELPKWAVPDKLDMWLGDNGIPISGGERKRLLLARAYLSGATILLLDEPFEGLDTQTAERIAVKIQAWSARKCILIASHMNMVDLLGQNKKHGLQILSIRLSPAAFG